MNERARAGTTIREARIAKSLIVGLVPVGVGWVPVTFARDCESDPLTVACPKDVVVLSVEFVPGLGPGSKLLSRLVSTLGRLMSENPMKIPRLIMSTILVLPPGFNPSSRLLDTLPMMKRVVCPA